MHFYAYVCTYVLINKLLLKKKKLKQKGEKLREFG